eukprot:scaffold157481_cov33-Attheya_sp.AAC.2
MNGLCPQRCLPPTYRYKFDAAVQQVMDEQGSDMSESSKLDRTLPLPPEFHNCGIVVPEVDSTYVETTIVKP